MFKGIQVGDEGVVVSHLQYADETIFFGEWESGNARNLMCIMKCFEEVSGLKVNMDKSRLNGVEVTKREVIALARGLKCSVGEIPFVYLGLPIGERMWSKEAWNQ